MRFHLLGTGKAKWMGWEKTGKSDGYILDETSTKFPSLANQLLKMKSEHEKI